MKFYTRRRVSPVITIVSLVDILTMVLMFFVYTTTFKTNVPQVEITLPELKSSGDKQAETPPAILTISPKDELFLDAKPVTLDELGAAVKELQGRTLALKADEHASFGTIMKVLDELKTSGVRDLPAFTRGPK